MKNRILIFQRTLPHYRLDIFREVHKATGAILCFGKNGPPGTFLTKVVPDFKHLRVFDFYPFKKRDTVVIQDVFTPLFRNRPGIVIMDPELGNLSNLFFWILRPFLKYKLIFWGHGYNRRTGFNPEQNFADKLRVWSMNMMADAVIFHSSKSKAVISKYLNRPEKVFVAPNTLHTRKLITLRRELEGMGKDNLKKEVGFSQKYNLIYIGRILEEKEPDRLIDVFRIITKKLNSVELHFVGNGPLIRQLKNGAQGLKVKFWGDITDDYQTGRLIFASDIMVMPGDLGLSVVHSFCFDRPVVSQKKEGQALFYNPAVEYLIEGKTAFLTEYGNNELMAETIINYLKDEKRQLIMKKEIRSTVESICNIDNMMNGVKKALDYVNKDG